MQAPDFYFGYFSSQPIAEKALFVSKKFRRTDGCVSRSLHENQLLNLIVSVPHLTIKTIKTKYLTNSAPFF
jgi:hypothetical protein